MLTFATLYPIHNIKVILSHLIFINALLHIPLYDFPTTGIILGRVHDHMIFINRVSSIITTCISYESRVLCNEREI